MRVEVVLADGRARNLLRRYEANGWLDVINLHHDTSPWGPVALVEITPLGRFARGGGGA